jgi:hypothetical protein
VAATNPVAGVLGYKRVTPLRLVQPRWRGEFLPWQHAGPAVTAAGVGAKHPAANSSTMRGRKRLASESDSGRCRTGNKPVIDG